MHRREFLRTTCSYCLLTSTGLLLASINSCAAIPTMDAGVVDSKVTIPLSAFTESDLQIVRPSDRPYDIALRKQTDGSFRALVLICTHASTQLTPTENGYTCPAHGSVFDTEGRAIRGPAQKPLRELSTERTQGAIVIHLPA